MASHITDEYRKFIEKDAALERRFQTILVDEPSQEDTIAILRGLKERYEVHHGVDITVIALWLGHESIQTTQIYLHADMAMKEKALAHATKSKVVPKRYRPPDQLLAFLESL